MTKTQNKLKMLIVTALFAAIIGILAQLTIPLPLVPITGQTLAIGLAATILGSRHGTMATVLYVIIGAVGVPVFSQMTAGIGIILGPTGGFIAGFIPSTFVIGLFLEKFGFSIKNAFIANVIGMLITLSIGTIWLKVAVDVTWTAAFMSGFVPFIIVGIIKAFLAGWIGILVRRRLLSNNLLIA